MGAGTNQLGIYALQAMKILESFSFPRKNLSFIWKEMIFIWPADEIQVKL